MKNTESGQAVIIFTLIILALVVVGMYLASHPTMTQQISDYFIKVAQNLDKLGK